MNKHHFLKALVCSMALCTLMSLAGCGNAGSQEPSAPTPASSTSSTSDNTPTDTSPTPADSAPATSTEAPKDPSNATPGIIVDSGTCGENVTWELDENGLIVISGSGKMNDYFSADVPWYKKRDTIKTAIVNNGVTNIGGGAFDECENLTSVTIPDSVTRIEENAFCGCVSLTGITIPDSVIIIGDYAFDETPWYDAQPDGLVYAGKVLYKYKGEMPENTHLVLADGTKGIAESALYGCNGLTSITIPDSVLYIGHSSFQEC